MTNPYININELCKWLKANGSGVYRPSAHAATVIEEQDSELTTLRDENDRLRAKLAEMESQEPAGKITKWLNGNTAICSGEGFAAADIYAEIYFRPVPAEKPAPEHKGWYCAHCQCGVDPSEVTYNEAHTVCGRIITDDEPPVRSDKPAPRITEQDAREIINTYIDNKIGVPVNEWLTPLLNKLNADREQVPAVAVPDIKAIACAFVSFWDHYVNSGDIDEAFDSWIVTAEATQLLSAIAVAPSHSQQSSFND